MYPRTIDDGHGSRMTFVSASAARLDIRSHVDPGAGPPMHVHHLQSETVRVEAGKIGVQIAGEPERFAGPGDELVFAPGVAHRFWNAGDTEAIISGSVEPPDNAEWFLTQVYASTAAHGGRPGALDSAYLMTRYRSEFAITAIPAPIRRLVFPVQAFLGRLFGRYGQFSHAPAPITRRLSATLPGRSTTSARSSAG